MGVLILSFAIWGIADMFKGSGQSTVATIGKTTISTEQFRQLFTEKVQQIGRQFGRPLTTEQARAFGLDRQVLQQAVAEAALDEDARNKRLAISDEEVLRLIMNDPNFKGPTGAFDGARFQQLIRQLGYNEARFIAEQRKVSLRRQIAGTVTAGVEPSKTQIEALSRFQNETRAINFIKLGAAQAGKIEAPTAEALQKFYDDNKVQFRAPEYRKAAYLMVNPEEISRWTTVSDEDAKALFDKTKDRLSTPEQRQIAQIVFPTAEEAKAAHDKLKAGTSFEDLAKDRGLSPSDIDLGLVTKTGIIDQNVANVAFSLAAGAVSEPITGAFGTVLVKVDKIEAGKEPGYDEYADRIKRELAIERARATVVDLHNKMEDERGGGSNVLDAAKKLGLTAVTIDAVDRSGRGPDGQPVSTLPEGVELLPQIFANEVGVEADAIQFKGGYVWFDVLEVTPSRERPLDEVKDQVEARWRADEVATRLRKTATELADKLGDSGNLTEAATTLGVKLETAKDLKRGVQTDAVPSNVSDAAFRAAKGAAVVATGATEEEWYVLRVTDIAVPALDVASDDIKQLKESLRSSMTDEQIAQYVRNLETKVGVNINANAFAIATGAASANN